MQLEELKAEKLSKSTIAFGMYLFLLPFDFINVGLGSVSKLLSLIVIAVTLLGDIRKMKFPFEIIAIMALYITWNFFSMFYSMRADNTIERITSLVLNYALIIVCGSTYKNKREIEFLEKAIVLSGWVVVVLMLFFSTVTSEFRVILYANGQEQDPNELCGFLMLPIVYYFKNLFNREKRTGAMLAFVFLILFAVFTGSRGGLIAIILACVSMFLFESKGRNKIFNLIIFALTLVILYMMIMSFAPEELVRRFDISYIENDRGAGRFDVWENVFQQYSELTSAKRIAGVGASTILLYSKNVVHNLWLETLFELGIVGVILLATMYMIFIKRAWRCYKKEYLSVMVGFLVMTMSLSLVLYKPIFAIFTMLIIEYRFDLEEMAFEEDEEWDIPRIDRW